jgi:hypothetical protein
MRRPCIRTGTLLERVERGVERRGPDECWLWRGSVRSDGYPRVHFNYGEYAPHRLMLEAAIGRALGAGELACHRCDVPLCCNPTHLFVGDHRANAADMVSKRREAHLHGQRNGKSLMTDEQALLLRRLRGEGVATRELAARFGLSLQATRHVIRGYSWKHLPIVPNQEAAR